MDIREALNIFEIKSIEGMNEEVLKKIYRRSVVKCHPDVAKSNDMIYKVNEAHETIKKYLENNVSRAVVNEKKRIIIDIEELNRIYLENDKNSEKILKDSIAYVRFNYTVRDSNDVRAENQIVRYDIYGKYSIEIKAAAGDIVLGICNKEVESSIGMGMTKIDIKLCKMNITFIIKSI